MLRLMRERFLPANFEQLLYEQYQKCRQGFKNVADYTEEFHRLGARTNLAETEDYKIARFIDGLRDDIQDQMDIQPFGLLNDAITMATKIEEKLEKKCIRGSTRRANWDKASTSRARTSDNGKHIAIGSTSVTTSTKTSDEPAKYIHPSKTLDTYAKKGTNPYVPQPWASAFDVGRSDIYQTNAPNAMHWL